MVIQDIRCLWSLLFSVSFAEVFGSSATWMNKRIFQIIVIDHYGSHCPVERLNFLPMWKVIYARCTLQDPPVPAPGSDSASASSLPPAGTPDQHMISPDIDSGVPPIPGRNTKSALDMASKKKTKRGGTVLTKINWRVIIAKLRLTKKWLNCLKGIYSIIKYFQISFYCRML